MVSKCHVYQQKVLCHNGSLFTRSLLKINWQRFPKRRLSELISILQSITCTHESILYKNNYVWVRILLSSIWLLYLEHSSNLPMVVDLTACKLRLRRSVHTRNALWLNSYSSFSLESTAVFLINAVCSKSSFRRVSATLWTTGICWRTWFALTFT